MIGGSSTAGNTIVTTCSIPADQSGTISGHWLVTPVPIAVHENDFSSSETDAILAAVTTWNTFFQSSKQKTSKLIATTNGQISTSMEENPRVQGIFSTKGILSGDNFNGSVVIYKIASWPNSYPANAIALTTFNTVPDPTSSSSYPSMFMAIMEINYQNFFGKNRFPDLQSIVLHELGHVLGLNHTCSAGGGSGFPNCSDPHLNPSYIAASMYPSFSFTANGMGQIKQSLGSNDESRINCLY